MNYPGINGFLGTRASLMLDLVSLAMAAILPVLGFSVWLVKFRRLYALHKRIQLTLASILLVAVVAFESDMRINGWKERASESPYFHTGIGLLQSWHASGFLDQHSPALGFCDRPGAAENSQSARPFGV